MGSSLNGFVKLHRKLIAWGWYQDYVVKDVFLHLLLTANFKDSQWMGVTLKKGQLVTSYKHLSEDLAFSVRQVRTAIDKLKSTGEITTEATNRFTIITVVNWEEYQLFDEKMTSEVTSNQTNERQTSDKQTTNERQQRKNDKNNKESKEEKESAAPLPPWAAAKGWSLEEYERWRNQ